MTEPKKTTRAYPKVLLRWVGDALADGSAYSESTLAMYAVEKGILRKEHANRFRLMAAFYMRKAGISPETTIEPIGVPLDAWTAKTWRKVLYAKAPKPTRRVKYRFLIEKAVKGELHHASSLAWLMTEDEARETGACNLATGRFMAYRWLSRFRRDLIEVNHQGTRGVQSKRNIMATYPAWGADVWKSAAEVPGYYGLHVVEILGEPVEVPPESE